MKDITTVITNIEESKKKFHDLRIADLASMANRTFFKEINTDICWSQNNGNLLCGTISMKKDIDDKLFEIHILIKQSEVLILLTTIYRAESIKIVNHIINSILSLNKETILNHYNFVNNIYELKELYRSGCIDDVNHLYDLVDHHIIETLVYKDVKYLKVFRTLIKFKPFKFFNINKLIK